MSGEVDRNLGYEPKVGMRVVCLTGPNPKRRGIMSNSFGEQLRTNSANYPEKAGVYTIRHVNEVFGTTLLLLVEVRNDHLTEFYRDGLEPGFNAKFFQPLESGQ